MFAALVRFQQLTKEVKDIFGVGIGQKSKTQDFTEILLTEQVIHNVQT